MSDHPTPERLAEYAYETLPSLEIELHVAECRECGWRVARFAAERRRLNEALSSAPPPELAERILARTPSRPVSWGLAASAALLLLSVTVWVVQLRNRREPPITTIVRVPAPSTPEEKIGSVLDGLCRIEVERSVAEMVARADMAESREGPLRETLLAAVSTTAEVFDRASRGEIDMESLLTTDTLAGLDARLRASLDEAEYGAVAGHLDRQSRDASQSAARRFLADLDLAAEQSSALTNYLVEKCSWRRDVAFLPEFARRHLCVHWLRSDGALRSDLGAAFTDEQSRRVLDFLDRESESHRRMWRRLRDES